MENEQTKVYVGRRSMCAGDDMNVPNMRHFHLPDGLDEFAAKLDSVLPFDQWTCYLGYPMERVSGEEDGIMVVGRRDDLALISAESDARDGKCTIVRHAENWHDLVKAHPYLFCE